MLIGLLADTHDRLPAIRAVLDRFVAAGIDTVIHPGDVVAPFAAKLLADFPGTVHVTYGNNDGERHGLKKILPQIQDAPLFVRLGTRHILVHHYLAWAEAADIGHADVIVTGHTHEPRIEDRDGKLFVNPGECCGWVTGHCTAAVLDLETNNVELLEVSP